MSNGLSLYLDLLRFFMAFEVMLGHSTFHAYMGKGFLWQIDPFRHLQTAVIGFFVLSGFVIAFVSKTKENNLVDYTWSRIARMHSVIMPALLVTLIFDGIGTLIDPGFYKTWDFPTPIGDNQVWGYFLSFIYLNNVWFIPQAVPGTNGPFWTMTYEVMFYAMFGAIWYLKGWRRYMITSAFIVFAGKSILILFPVWLMGFAVFHICSRCLPSKKWALLLFILSLTALVECSTMRPGFQWPFTGRATHLDYAAGVLVAVNIYAAAGIASMLSALLARVEQTVRWLGMLTFSLYLCHRPLLNFFSVVSVDAPTTLIQKVWVFGGTFAVVIVVAYIGEWLRIRIKIGLAALFKRGNNKLGAAV